MIKHKLPADIDPECIALCDAINSIPGLKTNSSCCGHGTDKYRIFFDVDDFEDLPILLYYIDPCHVGFRWWCKVETDCGMQPAHFYIESESVGDLAYQESETIAKEIMIELYGHDH